jgi:hypothetical protein
MCPRLNRGPVDQDLDKNAPPSYRAADGLSEPSAPIDSGSTSNASSFHFAPDSTGLSLQQTSQLAPSLLDKPDALPPAPYYPSEAPTPQQCWIRLRSSPPPAW